ncbi:hypothetical protein GJA_764 [Janthinobacterium agaricidamnosum NBRC 102515 = DSM 9628]|uniref:Uncharacterized protein n=1 Tax=Janthinobacterium agaricidamnosum NBRC 102515 = DSM 9628 TaxID=1349767 RepID=W0V264_9BURK|nr:hypothetical protein GJA_764 [Janthinobacterium agaricidamnosum NBRC 102515 = DSM 9628]
MAEGQPRAGCFQALGLAIAEATPATALKTSTNRHWLLETDVPTIDSTPSSEKTTFPIGNILHSIKTC